MARDEKARQVVQDLMQRYGRDNHLFWSAEKSPVMRRGGKGGMALDVGDGVAWLERAEEVVVLGHVQDMGAEEIRLQKKLLRGFRTMMIVFRNHPPSVQTTVTTLKTRVMKKGVSLEVLHVYRKDMKDYGKAGLHHAEFHRDQGVVEWGV